MTTTIAQQRFSNDDFPDCHFYPWVGPHYTDGVIDGLDGLRVLVLGESHYAYGLPVEKERGLTQLVIQEELEGKMRHRFISGVTRALFSRATVDDRARFSSLWNAMAFYNYVQEYAGDGPRKRPSDAAWQRSAVPFRSVLATLQPDFVLACGRMLYERLKLVEGLTDDGQYGDDGDKRTRSREIELGGGRRGVLGMIYHPASFGFRADEWHPRIGEYVQRAKRVKAEQRAG
jgi:hypothetical protein